MKKILFLFFIFFLFSSQVSANEQSIFVTVTVPLSKEWENIIKTKSTVRFSSPFIQITTGTIDNVLLKSQRIQMLVLINGILEDKEEKISDEKGIVNFSYTPKNKGSYRILFINKTYDRPVLLDEEINSY